MGHAAKATRHRAHCRNRGPRGPTNRRGRQQVTDIVVTTQAQRITAADRLAVINQRITR